LSAPASADSIESADAGRHARRVRVSPANHQRYSTTSRLLPSGAIHHYVGISSLLSL
jgi:hypothetical protein